MSHYLFEPRCPSPLQSGDNRDPVFLAWLLRALMNIIFIKYFHLLDRALLSSRRGQKNKKPLSWLTSTYLFRHFSKNLKKKRKNRSSWSFRECFSSRDMKINKQLKVHNFWNVNLWRLLWKAMCFSVASYSNELLQISSCRWPGLAPESQFIEQSSFDQQDAHCKAAEASANVKSPILSQERIVL